MAQQYINRIGDEVEVIDAEGKKVQGKLKEVNGKDFTVTVQEKQTVEGKKRPVMVSVDKPFNMDTVRSTKYLLAFK